MVHFTKFHRALPYTTLSAGDEFGRAVAINGDTMVVAAPNDDDKGSNSGSVYVFTRNAPGSASSGWTQRAKLVPSDGAAGDQFGYVAVAIHGDTVVVGAIKEDAKGSDSGSAYVFTRDVPGNPISGWTQRAKLVPSDGAAGDYFGLPVEIHEDTVVVGAYQEDAKGSSSGAAYVFSRDVPGSAASGWTQRAKLVASDGAAGDQFGVAAAIDVDTIVVGADKSNAKGSNSGAAYVFTRDVPGKPASAWTQRAKLLAADGASVRHACAYPTRSCVTLVIFNPHAITLIYD